MSLVVFEGIFLPLLGTTLGAACVFFMKGTGSEALERSLRGFAAGVMMAASVWSLLLPAISQSQGLGGFAFFPAALGFCVGVGFLLALDRIILRLRMKAASAESEDTAARKKSMLVLAVVLHNLPEGMAVGVVLASLISGSPGVTTAAALSLAIGIAIQNFPEGSIISMPLAAGGEKKLKAFFQGFLSGVIEPVGAIVTILFAGLVTPVLPFMLSFAAGAMVFAVVEELVPEMNRGDGSGAGVIMFTLGFALMMSLDVALG